MSDKEQIGKALGRVASGLYVMTAHFDGRDDAILASWVNQCSFEPPAVSVALAKSRPARLLVEASEAFVLNVLGKESNGLRKRFGKALPPGSPFFEGLDARKGWRGITILNDAVAYLECELVEQMPAGDHVVYVGKIVGGDMLRGGEPYVHVRNSGFNY
jgi:flavin reductase (DIM6/NTAB) family NADH-FMN oxidoreductase RutF